jgi:predicted nuclease of predicted toxin-antitoxin system
MFLVDNALSPPVADALRQAGHEAVHVRELGLAATNAPAIFDRATQENRVVVSADTDFGTLLASAVTRRPRFCFFGGRCPDVQAAGRDPACQPARRQRSARGRSHRRARAGSD